MASTLSRRKNLGNPRRNEGAGSGPNPFFARESTGQTHVTPNCTWAWGIGRLDRSSFSGHPHSVMPTPWAQQQHHHHQQQQLQHQSSHARSSKDEYTIACRDRWLNVSKTMMGERAEIAMSCGSVYEGVIHAIAPKGPTPGGTRGSYQVVMRPARLRDMNRESSSTKVDRQRGTLVLAGEDIVSIAAKRFPLQQNARRPSTGLGTDAVIASRTSRGVGIRSLKKVESSWVTGGASSSLNGSIEKWDQFEANRRLFSVTSSFDENLYTSRLDKSSLTKQQIADAERLAAEISSKPSSNIHVREERNMMTKMDDSMGEEERFGGVLGTGGLAHDVPTSMASSAAGSGAVYVPPALRPPRAPVQVGGVGIVEGEARKQTPSTAADARLEEAKTTLMDVLDGRHRSTPPPKPEVASDTSLAVETAVPQPSTRGNEEAKPAAEAVDATPPDTVIPEKTAAGVTSMSETEKTSTAVVGDNDVPASSAAGCMTASSNAPPSVSGAASAKMTGVSSNPPVPATRLTKTGGDGSRKKSSLRASAKEWRPETVMGVGTKTSAESAASAPGGISSDAPAPIQAQHRVHPHQQKQQHQHSHHPAGGQGQQQKHSHHSSGGQGQQQQQQKQHPSLHMARQSSPHVPPRLGSMQQQPAQQLQYPPVPQSQQHQQVAMVIPPYSGGFMPATGAMGSVSRGPSHHMFGVPPHPMMALPPAQGQPQQYPQSAYNPWMGHHPQHPPLAGMCMSMAPGQPQEYAQQGVPTMMTQPGAGWPFYDERMPQQQQHYQSQMQFPPQAPVHQGQQQPRGFVVQGYPVAGPTPEPHYMPPEYRQTGGVAGMVDMGRGVNGGEVTQGSLGFAGHARRRRSGGRGVRGR